MGGGGYYIIYQYITVSVWCLYSVPNERVVYRFSKIIVEKRLIRSMSLLEKLWSKLSFLFTAFTYIVSFISSLNSSLLCLAIYLQWVSLRPPLCTYRLNWARRTSKAWWDEKDDTALQTQDSNLELCPSEAEHATSRSQWPPTILNIYE